MPVLWLKDNIPIAEYDDKYRMTNIGYNHSLAISKMTKAEMGQYSCTVGNKTLTCFVRVTAQPLRIIRGLTDVTLHIMGGRAEFECELSASVQQVDWIKYGRSLMASGKYDMEQTDGGKRCRLVVSNVDGRDVGTYCCIAMGKMTSANLYISVAISNSQLDS
jgi:hypothetical protein